MTRKPVMHAGLNIKIVIIVLDKGIKASNTIVVRIPPPNKYRSNGLNHPSINFPLFVFAGIN